ncbi:VOC family protein [Flavihumibacter rivuli]|uniref:VOC family protein n=1 Tax=Flavihumibacter rivuli TaxID=2838156 RepID=UPI001BDE045A|nr:VOC family protein [Flavihumibacter rivuli]ULQ55267.1 VOC family protein [Flavihumibacter rivuli]
MKIEHIALWTNRLEEMRAFYMRYFGASSNEQYHNPAKQFRSYFLSFETGARLEIMQMEGVPDSLNNIYDQFTGLIHFAMATGSKENVDTLTALLSADGYEVIDGPRWTGDGYYESVVLDPDKNRVEITI